MTQNLGGLANLSALIDRATIDPERAREAFKLILVRMAEIDAAGITKSRYRDLQFGEQDEPPTGDDFNALWDAVQDEIVAAIMPK